MCGISGIIGKGWKREQLNRMILSQKHRGPDATGIFVSEDEMAGLGHNRLSILDLSISANQPMWSDDRRYIVVFNGEIYNYLELKDELKKDYSFHTTSDTEVLLKAWNKWGKDCLSHFNGMFAFAIWDTQNQKIFAARDRFGVKPFYYALNEGKFIFASEIKALWAFGLEKKPFGPVWASYLSSASYTCNGHTFWENIMELPAGHWIEFDGRILQKERWYSFEQNIKATAVHQQEKELEEHYTFLLADAVSLRFRSDVPVGFNISGGLDSSVLLAMVNHLFPEQNGIRAFSFYTGHTSYDELPWVHKMISHTSHSLTACLLTPDIVSERISSMCAIQDEPFGGIPTMAYSRIFEEAAKTVTVLLDGQGMDEAWAGYDYYQNRNGFTIQGVTTDPARSSTIDDRFLKTSLELLPEQPFEDKLQNLQYRDLFYTKLPRALRFNDRISMMYSTELREPFLDYRLVELAFAQKPDMKLQQHQTKWLLRKIASRYLHKDISYAPKRAVQTPQREWLAAELKPLVEDAIVRLSDHAWFRADALRKEWSAYMEGNRDNSFYIWQWINTAQLLAA